jgi:transcription initiation factor TFIIIB Brf1 subunit/transcription initiation factor TFIIB
MSCPRCGGSLFEDGNFDSICSQCDAVVHCKSTGLVSEVAFIEGSNGRSYVQGEDHGQFGIEYSGGRFKDYGENIKSDLYKEVDRVCSRTYLMDDDNSKDNAKHYLQCLFREKWRGGETSRVKAAACVFISARINHKPVTINEVATCAQVDIHKLGKSYVAIKKQFEDNGIIDKMDAVSPQFFLERVCNLVVVNENNIKTMIPKITGILIDFCTKESLITGRNPCGITCACVVIALCSLGVKENSELIKKFETHFKLSYNTLQRRCNEIRDILLKFGSSVLPWRKSLTHENIVGFLDDIFRIWDILPRAKVRKVEQKEDKKEEEKKEEIVKVEDLLQFRNTSTEIKNEEKIRQERTRKFSHSIENIVKRKKIDQNQVIKSIVSPPAFEKLEKKTIYNETEY